MSESKMTPGPWYWANEGADAFGHTLNVRERNRPTGIGNRVASIVNNREADARAIAALPELIEAARTLLFAAEKCVDTASPWHGDVLRMRRILAKIEGE